MIVAEIHVVSDRKYQPQKITSGVAQSNEENPAHHAREPPDESVMSQADKKSFRL